MVTVNTKEELKNAIDNKEDSICVDNPELVAHIVEISKIKRLSRWTIVIVIGTIGVGTVLAVPTGGASAGICGIAALGVAATTSLSVSGILAIGALAILGFSTIYALRKDYDVEINFFGVGTAKLSKKR